MEVKNSPKFIDNSLPGSRGAPSLFCRSSRFGWEVRLQEQQCSMQEQDSNIEEERLEGEFVKLKDKMPIVIILVGNLRVESARKRN